MALNLPFLIKDAVRDPRTANKPLSKFIAQVKAGAMARTNRFAVLFSPPSGVSPANLQNILLFCDTIQLPAMNYSTVQNRTFGEFREVPYERLYDPINMTFYVDVDMKVKTLFDNWMNVVQNPSTRTFNYYRDYICDVQIEVQDLNDNTRYEVTLYECYPKNIGAIQMDQASKDPMKLSVTLQYKYWVAGPKTQLATGEKIPSTWFEKFTKNFDGFQRSLNSVVGDRVGNFITGSAMTYGVSKLPGLLRF
jgi:hypothetical protein